MAKNTTKKAKTTVSEPALTVRGKVTVSTFKGNSLVSKKTTHNNGVANLFVGIARFIRGDFLYLPGEGSSFLPTYLGVGYTENVSHATTNFADTSLGAERSDYINRFDVTKGAITTDSTQGVVKLKLSAVIPSGVFAEGTHINELGLFSQRAVSSSGLLARVVYTQPDSTTLSTVNNDCVGANHIKIQTGMSYQIDWEIIIGNKG